MHFVKREEAYFKRNRRCSATGRPKGTKSREGRKNPSSGSRKGFEGGGRGKRQTSKRKDEMESWVERDSCHRWKKKTPLVLAAAKRTHPPPQPPDEEGWNGEPGEETPPKALLYLSYNYHNRVSNHPSPPTASPPTPTPAADHPHLRSVLTGAN